MKIETVFLTTADQSDPLNQLFVVGVKMRAADGSMWGYKGAVPRDFRGRRPTEMLELAAEAVSELVAEILRNPPPRAFIDAAKESEGPVDGFPLEPMPAHAAGGPV